MLSCDTLKKPSRVSVSRLSRGEAGSGVVDCLSASSITEAVGSTMAWIYADLSAVGVTPGFSSKVSRYTGNSSCRTHDSIRLRSRFAQVCFASLTSWLAIETRSQLLIACVSQFFFFQSGRSSLRVACSLTYFETNVKKIPSRPAVKRSLWRGFL